MLNSFSLYSSIVLETMWLSSWLKESLWVVISGADKYHRVSLPFRWSWYKPYKKLYRASIEACCWILCIKSYSDTILNYVRTYSAWNKFWHQNTHPYMKRKPSDKLHDKIVSGINSIIVLHVVIISNEPVQTEMRMTFSIKHVRINNCKKIVHFRAVAKSIVFDFIVIFWFRV